MSPSRRRPATWLPITLIVLVAFGLRAWAWDAAPPGLTHDEAAHLQDAQRIWDGARPIYLSTAYGREPLFDYATAPLVGLLGMRVTTGRLAAALWGTALVAAVYAWALRAFDRETATLAAALLALSFWPLATGRQILRSGTLPALLTATMALFWQGVFPARGRHRRRHFILAGLLLGLSFYTYMPARITWIMPVAVGAWLIVADRARWRATRAGFAWTLAITLLVAAPLLGYLAAHPELEVRVDELAAPLQALTAGDPAPLLARVREGIGMFSHRGDTQWIYNIADRPLLLPPVALLFFLGVLVALVEGVRRRRPALWLLLLWLVLGLAPALVTGLESSSLRAIAAQPAVFVLAALPLAAAGRRLARYGAPWVGAWRVLLAAGALALMLTTGRDYFCRWAADPATRVAYHSHLASMVGYLNERDVAEPVSLSTIYPGYYHDPYAAEVLSGGRGEAGAWRWYDARFALVFPAAGEATALFPALAPLDAALQPYFAPYARPVERVELQPDDLSPWFDVVRWSPDLARSALPLQQQLELGDLLQFRGSEFPGRVRQGDELDVITFWAPLGDASPDAGDLVLFVHLLDGGQVVAQQDRLDVPPTAWHPGDLFAHLHRLEIPQTLPPGRYELETGAYWRAEDYPRLLVEGGGVPIGDRILLSVVTVTTAD